jgi:polygalacturonase
MVTRRSMLKTLSAAGLVLAYDPDVLAQTTSRYDVRSYGATGDGHTLDTTAVQRAIDGAAKDGGGIVHFPAGSYLSFSLRLRSQVTLEFAPGSTLLAATPDFSVPSWQYDVPEAQPAAIVPYQDYGHNHWQNSLLWGENLHDIAIVGQGLIWGRGLQKGDGPEEERAGAGNKAIALKNCRNVLLRDISILDPGHFGVLASGVNSITVDNVRIDTRRDGIDIDGCRNVHITNCTVNAPWDDGIVLKSSYSLGELRPTEEVTIDNCIVSGSYQLGTMLDGTYLPFPAVVKDDPPSRIGRIKIGTETNGDIRTIVVSNCVLQGCHGLAVESEDGAHVEDIRFVNITMRDLIGPPFFLRLGTRMRGPDGATPGTVQRIAFESIDCWNATSAECSILSGVPGHMIRDVNFHNIQIEHQGGGSLRKGELPELQRDYPDPQMFGPTPAQGFFIRHVEGLRMVDVEVRASRPDPRPLFVLDDVRHANIVSLQADRIPTMEGRAVEDVHVSDESGKALTILPYHP